MKRENQAAIDLLMGAATAELANVRTAARMIISNDEKRSNMDRERDFCSDQRESLKTDKRWRAYMPEPDRLRIIYTLRSAMRGQDKLISRYEKLADVLDADLEKKMARLREIMETLFHTWGMKWPKEWQVRGEKNPRVTLKELAENYLSDNGAMRASLDIKWRKDVRAILSHSNVVGAERDFVLTVCQIVKNCNMREYSAL